MENKLTAIEFLANNLHYLHSTKWDDILIQAKEMEKAQLIDAFNDSRILSVANNCNSGNQYYNQTFNK